MSFSKFSSLLGFPVLILTLIGLTSTSSFAKFEQKMLSVNDQNKKVTFTLYHFDSSKVAKLTDVTNNVGDSAKQQKSVAAISASDQANFSYESGKFIFSKTISYFIKNGASIKSTKPLRNSKHNFILTDDKGRHAICYTPLVSETELSYALQQFIATSKVKFTSAVIINSGNECCFYKTNGKYRPYYLKELKKPAKALIIK